MKRKSIWDEAPLNKLDLLKEVEKRQKRNPKITKMDIFRFLSKKYNRILTPDQFNFRYNYLISKQRKEAIKKVQLPKDILTSNIVVTSAVPDQEVQIAFKPYRFVINEFRDDKQKLLNINKALYEMIDPNKLAKFCDSQLKLQKRRQASGGFNLIVKRLAELFDQKESTIASRYYSAKNRVKNKSTRENPLNKLKQRPLVKLSLFLESLRNWRTK